MTTTEETVLEREQFYVGVELRADPINCGDDRKSGLDKYIHVFGGELFVAYTQAVLAELRHPGSSPDVAALNVQVIDALQAAGFGNLEVHSDEAAENGSVFDAGRADGAVGCGYAGKRAAISSLIHESGQEIIDEAGTLFPELFFDDWAQSFGGQVTAAHGRLVGQSQQAIGEGRALVRGAVAQGAGLAIFSGSHVATEGIINTQPDTSFQTAAAHDAGLAAYDHDLWASDELLAMLPDAPDPREAAIASIIDVIGTMKALGVTRIARR